MELITLKKCIGDYQGIFKLNIKKIVRFKL